MMGEQINATRMELLKLKEKLLTVRRGHKLLKDKQDEMIKQFMTIARNYKDLREEVETSWIDTLKIYESSKITHSNVEIYEKMMVNSNDIEAGYHKKNILGVNVPTISFMQQNANLTFSLIDSDQSLDQSILLLGNLFPKILELSKSDKTCRILANEIERGRRRVNAIEHFMIPELRAKIKEINVKLGDAERASIIRTIKSKEIIIKKTIPPL